ncbi:DUF1269 domain-containing protein [Undibacterium sp. Xuan67W]|uniref:DUF1269 domain-containing protein n=1 Tax=Undibacterium sp. Xuan67W TaxID=3413057 RepID=UPI003BF43B07
MDELLLARVDERSLHFHAKEGSLPRDMPEANFVQKTDLIHGAEVGMLIGAFSGLLAGSMILIFPPEGIKLRTIFLLASIIGGAFFGSWASGMAAAAIPNSRLKKINEDIERGQVLMMVDGPYHRVAQVEDLIAKRHPEVGFGGVEQHMPVFS